MVEICCENNMIFIDVATILKIFHETTYIQFNHFTCTIHAFTYYAITDQSLQTGDCTQ